MFPTRSLGRLDWSLTMVGVTATKYKAHSLQGHRLECFLMADWLTMAARKLDSYIWSFQDLWGCK